MPKERNTAPPSTARNPSPTAPRLIVGVGASAGGLNAFSELLRGLPPDTGAAFIFVQHLSPTHKSIMADLLVKHTPMPVREASDGLQVKANHVYMIPPDSIMSLSRGRIRLAKPLISRYGRQLPIDEFLISLADDAAERSVGVILSGTGSDGTMGVKAITEAGGVVVVEDPGKADYPGMPKSAAATGMADFVLPIPELAKKLADFARQPHLIRRSQDQAMHGLDEQSLVQIIEALHLRTGYDFREYKKPTLSRRIQRRMGLRNISEPANYIDVIQTDDQESALLFKDMLIGVTSFFRDREAFAELRRKVLAPLVSNHAGKTPIRVWVAGCTTGEEAYSVAILLYEEFAQQKISFNAQIFATDIDEDAVVRARAGHYSANVANEIPENYLRAYFDEEDSGFTVKKILRESVIFAVQNLIGDPPFSKLDLICCRNVLIYLETSMQNKLLRLFHFALGQDGYLFLGSSESVTQHEQRFTPVSKPNRLFQRNALSTQNSQQLKEHPVYSIKSHQLNRDGPINPPNNTLFSAAETTRDTLLTHYAPPAVLVNSNYDILYFQGETNRYLNQPEGEPTNDLCAIAVSGLKTKIRAAVQKARKTGNDVVILAKQVKRTDGTTTSVNVSAHPVRKTNSSETLLLVSFSDCGIHESEPEQLIDDKESELSSQLEYELFATRQDLQSTIEQLETSNEELKASNEEIMSMNEELQSSNEELETSREELQSLNEELNTVNNQLEENVRELESVNNDLSNLLSSTDIATIFLDAHLRIRRFTPATHSIIRLIDSDIGRPLADLAMNFADKYLIEDAKSVLETLRPIENEVSDTKGQHYLRRITHYRTYSKSIEALVLT
ncbi:MAG: CheR family methyltransferase, partial [Cellvibrionaceae bacterium]